MLKNLVAFGPTDYIHLYDTWAKMLATHFLDMLEQKVKHVSDMKFDTDQESSRFQYVRGTLVIFVLVYWTAYHVKYQNNGIVDAVILVHLILS